MPSDHEGDEEPALPTTTEHGEDAAQIEGMEATSNKAELLGKIPTTLVCTKSVQIGTTAPMGGYKVELFSKAPKILY